MEIPSSLVKAEIDRAVKKLQKRAKLPGFRPGKIPVPIIKNRYSHLLKEEVINKLIPEYYQKALAKHNLRPLHSPTVDDIHFKEGEPLKFKARFEVAADIKINDYIAIKVKKPAIKLNDEEVDAALKSLQEKAAEMMTIENRPARPGDYLIMDTSWKIEGTKGKPMLQRDALIFLGSSDNLPQLNEQLKHLSLGENKEFTLQYPEDWQVKHFAGKKLHYHVKLKEIKEKRLPALDDNFAKDLGEFATLAELKEKVIKDLTKQKNQEIEAQINNTILKKIIEKNPLEVPEVWLKEELDFRARQLLETLASQGGDPNQINLDWEKFRQENRAAALETVKKRMVLNHIARQEKLEVSEEELKAGIEEIAKKSGESFAAVRNYLATERRIDAVKEEMLQRKTLDFLRDKAIILNKGK